MALKRQRSPARLIDRLLKPAQREATILLEPRPYARHVREIAAELGIALGHARERRSDRAVLHEAEWWVRRYGNFCGSLDLAFPLCPRSLRAFSQSSLAWHSCSALDILLTLERVNAARGARACISCSDEHCTDFEQQWKRHLRFEPLAASEN
jgi:hypothetical protein